MLNEKEEPLVNEGPGNLNEPNEQPPRQPWTFSIFNLLMLTTVVALLIGIVPLLGVAIIPLIGLTLLFVVCAFAHANKLAIPFWAAIGGFAILVILLPPLGLFAPSNDEAVISCFMFGAGIYLAYYSIRNGHWATRWVGLVVIAHYLFVLLMLSIQTLETWPRILDYWFGE